LEIFPKIFNVPFQHRHEIAFQSDFWLKVHATSKRKKSLEK